MVISDMVWRSYQLGQEQHQHRPGSKKSPRPFAQFQLSHGESRVGNVYFRVTDTRAP